jgi:hypothetical protein
LSACGDDDPADADAAVSIDATPAIDADLTPDANTLMPQTLCESGLYSDCGNETLADGVYEFEPQYPLWTDGATKRRWIYLPPGEQIDTSDMDYWVYPVGTKMWKEFTRDGTRIETRILFKTGPDVFDWYKVAYIWNVEQTEATAAPGGMDDVLGTDHDVPAINDCNKCHERMNDIGIGFSAIQLDHELGGVTLGSLITDDLLTDTPNGQAPYYGLPGDATDQAALGYLHSNCGHCHNAQSDVQDVVAVELKLEVGALNNVNQTRTYVTAVNVVNQLGIANATHIITGGNPDSSSARIRMNIRGPTQMPQLGTEDVDATGLAAFDAWINTLPAP